MDLTPENDLQELWELNGRVKSVIIYCRNTTDINKNVILEMLGEKVNLNGDVAENE